jgi:4-hydroxybenzoate polyprenyltransferase
MTQGAMICAALCTAFWGFTALSLAMDRHHEASHGRDRMPAGRRRRGRLQLAGTLGLLSSLLACLAVQGATQGWVLWCGVLTVGALALVLLLAYAPARVPLLGRLAAAAALLAAGVAALGG